MIITSVSLEIFISATSVMVPHLLSEHLHHEVEYVSVWKKPNRVQVGPRSEDI